MKAYELSSEASKEREGAIIIELEREREEHRMDSLEKLSLSEEMANLKEELEEALRSNAEMETQRIAELREKHEMQVVRENLEGQVD